MKKLRNRFCISPTLSDIVDFTIQIQFLAMICFSLSNARVMLETESSFLKISKNFQSHTIYHYNDNVMTLRLCLISCTRRVFPLTLLNGTCLLYFQIH